MKTFLTLISFFVLSLSSVSAAQNGVVKDVKVVDATTLKITLDGVTNLSDPISGDVKVLKDISVLGAQKNTTNDKIVSISLGTALLPETSYSLLSVFGAEGNMDFVTKKELTNSEFINTDPQNTTIDKVVVKDEKNIEVHYKLSVKSEEFDYKILSNLGVSSIIVDKVNPKDMLLSLTNKLEPQLDYILMLVSLKDGSANEIDFAEGIVDFKSGEITTPKSDTSLPTVQTGANLGMLTVSGSQMPDLNAAAVIGENANPAEVEKKLTEEVAGEVAETPSTGAETWFLILGTLLMTTFITFARRKQL